MEDRHQMTSTSDPEHWYDRAYEARRIAEMLPEEARKAMLKVADEYKALALWAEGKGKYAG